MKHIFNSAFILCSLLASIFMMGACGSDDDDNNAGGGSGTGSNGNIVQTDTLGTVARPTDWVVKDTLYYPSAMTFVINNSGLPASINKDDLIAAFINDTCRAVSSPLSDLSGFFLSVSCPQGKENDANLKLILRYYSTNKKIIYSSNEITFVDSGIFGDLDNGYKPNWTITSK